MRPSVRGTLLLGVLTLLLVGAAAPGTVDPGSAQDAGDVASEDLALEAHGEAEHRPLRVLRHELREVEGPAGHGAPAPEDTLGIGPGSTLIVDIQEDGEDTVISLCTAGFVFRDVTTGALYLGAAGHCFMGQDATTTHGDAPDWDPDDTVRVRVCVADCLGGATALSSSALEMYPSATEELGRLVYARATGLGSDFGVVEIPHEHVEAGKVRTDVPMWHGPTDPPERIALGDTVVHYGSGVGLGELYPARGRTGVGVDANDERWLAEIAITPGDSGSPVNIATVGEEGAVEGHAPAGIVTHLVVGAGITGGTNVDRAIALTQEAGLDLAVAGGLDGGEGPDPDPGPTEPEPSELSNLEHVFNFDPDDHDPDRDPSVGSDLEFFSHTVPLRDHETGRFVDADGDPLPDGAEPVLAERDFAVVGSYQRGGYVFDITDPEDVQLVTQVTCRQPRNDVAIREFTDPETGEPKVVLALTQQSGNPCGGAGGVGVDVNSPTDLAGFREATQWSGTAAVDDQTADLVYAGTGCTPAHYVGAEVQGRIALIDDNQGREPHDVCPTYTFKQKMEAAERAGAIGLVQVERDDDVFQGNAIQSGIPGLALANSLGAPIRDAVVAGTTVNVTLADAPVEVPLLGSGSGGIGVFDITDPAAWEPMYFLRTGHGGVHNFAFHPTAPYGYVSNGALPGGINTIPIVDFTDLDDPIVREGPQTEGGVHDLEFTPDGRRAYAASENNYRVYDTTEPADPVLLSRTPNVGSYAHGVFPTSDAGLMVTNNESLVLGGFLVGGSAVCPGEGLASYDLTDETAPAGPLGYYVPEVVGPVGDRYCTSHFGRFAPDTDVMSMGWYAAGVRIIDWSDPTAPVEVASAMFPDSNTWAAKFHEGPYVYAGDVDRGFDVFRWTGEGPAPWLADGPGGPEAGVEVSCVDCSIEVRAGESGTAELTVRNTGEGQDTFQLAAEEVPEGWTASVEPQQVTLAPGDRADVTLTVEVPRRERRGSHRLAVHATSSSDPQVSDAASVEVQVVKGPPSDRGRPSQAGASGQRGASGSDGALATAVYAGSLTTAAVLLALLVGALTRWGRRAHR